MAQGTRDIKRKIKSVKNTRQITKAMELVAASKMRKAVENAQQLRAYAQHAQALLSNLADKVDKKNHPLLAEREVKKELVIVFSTDKGLCGGLNTNLFRQLSLFIKKRAQSASAMACAREPWNKGRPSEAEPIKRASERQPKPHLHFVAVGKKVQDFLRRMKQEIIAAYPAMSNRPSIGDIYPISRMVLAEYVNANYDKVVIAYTDFISAIRQRPTVRRLLPLSRAALDEMIAGLDTASHVQRFGDAEKVAVEEYLFEPAPDTVLEMLLPRLTEMQIYQAVLEASASEHSSRMFAMRNATEAADELVGDLTFTYNQIRQATITRELAEISAGRAAQE